MFAALVRTDHSPAQLFIRLALAIVIFPHGVQKVFGWFGGPGFDQTLEMFAGMGFPTWSVILLMITEIAGPICLVLGLLSRLWALAIGTSMAICMFLNHVQHGFFMNWFGQQQGEGIEYHILIFGITLALIFRGSGAASIDRACTKDRRKGTLVF